MMSSTIRVSGDEMELAFESLKHRDRLNRLATRPAKVGAWSFDADKMESEFTDEIYRMHEVDPESEAEKQKWKPIIQKQANEVYAAAKKTFDPETGTFAYDFETTTAKGNVRHLRSIGYSVMEGDRVIRIEGMLQDITELINAAEIAQHKDRIIDALLSATPDLLILLDMVGTIRECRARQDRELHLSSELFLNKKLQDVLPPHIGDQFDQAIGQVRELGGASFGYELAVPDGLKHHTASFHNLPESKQVLTIVREDTQEYNQTRKLAEREKRFRNLLENAPIPVVIMRARDSQILYYNRGVNELFNMALTDDAVRERNKLHHERKEMEQLLERLHKDGLCKTWKSGCSFRARTASGS